MACWPHEGQYSPGSEYPQLGHVRSGWWDDFAIGGESEPRETEAQDSGNENFDCAVGLCALASCLTKK